MKTASTIARYLTGVIFLVFGLNGFLNFIPLPPPGGIAGQFMGALYASHYLWVIFAFQVIAAVLLLINRYVPLAVAVLAPVIVNILSFHALMAPSGLPLALLVAVLWAVIFVDRALAGAWGVFGVQNAGEAGVEREEAQGKRLATLARNTGVEHYVYTSVGSADKRTGVPHFDNKWRIEETVRGLRFPTHVILRPVFFMENLTAPFSLQGSTLAWALGPDTKLQMIAVEDIGWFGARAFTDAAALNRREIDLAGDVRTMPQAAATLTEGLGRPIAFAQTPIEPVRQYSKEMALMLEWFERVGYSADIARLEREFGRSLTKLPDWARLHTRPSGR